MARLLCIDVLRSVFRGSAEIGSDTILKGVLSQKALASRYAWFEEGKRNMCLTKAR